MSATSETEICNLALTRIGHQMISNLDEGTKAADLCRLHYPRARNALLRDHPWNFAIKRATLALETETPNHEFAYYHALPGDCIKVLRTGWEAENMSTSAYRVEGRRLACNETVVDLEYVGLVTDVSQFDEMFTDVLAQRVAAEVCMALTDNQAATKTMWEIYTAKIVDARTTDAQEGTPRDVIDSNGWILARA